jgi:hypothetical protein
MKYFILFLLFQIGFGLALHGQGLIVFNNLPPNPNAPIFHVDCATPLAGDSFRVQLYAAPANTPESSLAPVGTFTSFFSEAGAGFFSGATISVPGVPPGSTATLQVRAWEANWTNYEEAVAAGGLHGRSDVFHISLAGLAGSAVNLRGLESFCLVPEPSTWALGLLGLTIFLWKTKPAGTT